MPVHTPGALGSAGNDDQGAATDNLAAKYPNTVDALAGMIYPDLPGGPDANAPRSPDAQVHYPSVRLPVDPTTKGMPQYGKVLGTQLYQTTPEE